MTQRMTSRDAARCAAALLLVLATTPIVVGAQGTESPISIHGFLTQGAARATDAPVFGIDRSATTDYRTAALQVRYAISDADNFLVQFSHRRMGKSLLNSTQPDVAIDWVFYQRQIAGAVIKVGRVPMPRGIYNEVRDVGTLLPFYRAPYNFYTEGMETIDGAVARYHFGVGGGFALDLSAFGGGWDFKQLSFFTSTGEMAVASSRAEKVFGGQAWLHTPLTGVRIGINGQRFTFDPFQLTESLNGSKPQKGSMYGVSLDATREHYFLRGEYGYFGVEGKSFEYPTWYAQAGIKPLRKVGLNVQTERARVDETIRLSPSATMPFSFDYAQDDAIGATYSVTPAFVLKAEGHEAKGYNFDSFVNPSGPSARTRYWVAGASVSF